jgi:hypothetical protein
MLAYDGYGKKTQARNHFRPTNAAQKVAGLNFSSGRSNGAHITLLKKLQILDVTRKVPLNLLFHRLANSNIEKVMVLASYRVTLLNWNR